MKISSLVLPSLALGAGTLLMMPGSESLAFTLTGSSLNLGQRDFRVRNNFADAATNDNVTPHVMFPGALGVFMATWKGVAEWGSEVHGDGSGDPSQGILGSGGANFDGFWSGRSTGVGTTNENVISTTTGCSSGVLAFAELPSSDGWRIRFCDDSFIFSDGPAGTPFSQFDYQGILCHEYGHVLGLGHSADGGATMFASINNGSNSARSINADDIAGVQAIYGAKSATKPVICKTEAVGGMLTITGSGFAATGNDVWFNRLALSMPDDSPIVIAAGVASSAGGTRIDVAIPVEAGPGDVAVRLPGSIGLGRLLSNCFPSDLVGTIEADCPFQLESVSPVSVLVVNPGTTEFMTLTGQGLDLVTSITLEPSTLLDPSTYTIVDASMITLDLPVTASLGVNTLTVDSGGASSSIDFNVITGSNPILEMGTGDPFNVIAHGETFTATLGGMPGSTHRIFYSNSNIPSSVPKASFLMGNNFSDFHTGPDVVIGANGVGIFSMPLVYTNPALVFYVQSLDLTGGAMPAFKISNLQSVTLTP